MTGRGLHIYPETKPTKCAPPEHVRHFVFLQGMVLHPGFVLACNDTFALGARGSNTACRHQLHTLVCAHIHRQGYAPGVALVCLRLPDMNLTDRRMATRSCGGACDYVRASQVSVRIEKVGDKQLMVHYEKDGEKMSMEAGLVLFGTGRKPNTDRLNLEARFTPFAVESTQFVLDVAILSLCCTIGPRRQLSASAVERRLESRGRRLTILV